MSMHYAPYAVIQLLFKMWLTLSIPISQTRHISVLDFLDRSLWTCPQSLRWPGCTQAAHLLLKCQAFAKSEASSMCWAYWGSTDHLSKKWAVFSCSWPLSQLAPHLSSTKEQSCVCVRYTYEQFGEVPVQFFTYLALCWSLAAFMQWWMILSSMLEGNFRRQMRKTKVKLQK